MNYTETKKQLDAIRNKYNCAGDVILKTAIQALIESGAEQFMDDNWFKVAMRSVDIRHDKAEAEGKFLFMTRDFEKALLECAKELAEINAYDLLAYIQQEVWLGGGEVGEPDYQRAMEIIRNCLCYTSDGYGAWPENCGETLNTFRQMDLSDDEIAYFGWEYLFDVEEEEE